MAEESWVKDADGALFTKATVLVEKFPDRLHNVDVDTIHFVRLVGSTASWLGKTWLVKAPFHLLAQNDETKYIIAINDDRCCGLMVSPLLEIVVLLRELLHIGNGKIIPYDVKDFSWMLRRFGPDYDRGEPPDVNFEQNLADLMGLFPVDGAPMEPHESSDDAPSSSE